MNEDIPEGIIAIYKPQALETDSYVAVRRIGSMVIDITDKNDNVNFVVSITDARELVGIFSEFFNSAISIKETIKVEDNDSDC
jgi:hypothetical protein